MSVCSNMSDISVVLNGEEILIEKAIDDTFTGIQRYINNSQCSLRTLCQLIDQDGDFKTSLELTDDIIDDIDGMMALFKDLKKILKVIKIRPENDDEKKILEQHLISRKMAKTSIKE